MALSCVGLMCVRNEQLHIRQAIEDFVAQGIDVAIIDHGSTDDTAKIYAQFRGHGLVSVEHMPWTGEFDLSAQLLAKFELLQRLDHDWVVHADADEWLHTTRRDESLLDGIERISRLGCNAINFDEFVFLPEPGARQASSDCRREMLDYYYFAPSRNRLMRAWERKQSLNNLASGGHRLAGPDLRLAEESFVLRHYIVLSQQQAYEKYGSRVFSARDLEKGWHGNRLNIARESLRLPEPSVLEHLPDWRSVDFVRDHRRDSHFWQWSAADRGIVDEILPIDPGSWQSESGRHGS